MNIKAIAIASALIGIAVRVSAGQHDDWRNISREATDLTVRITSQQAKRAAPCALADHFWQQSSALAYLLRDATPQERAEIVSARAKLAKAMDGSAGECEAGSKP